MKKALILAAMAALFLAACGDDSGTSNDSLGIPDATAAPGITVQTDHDAGGGAHGGGEVACTAATGKLTIVAHSKHFDHHCLAAKANQAFTITFENKDTVPYNLVILRTHTDPNPLFRGEYVTGPATTTYNVSALAPGEYAFHSEAATEDLGHGTLIVS